MIVRRHPATTGEFHWHVPLDFPCHEYLKLTVTDCDNEDAEDQSSVFMILAGAPRKRLATHPDLRMSQMRSGATQNDAPIDLPPDLPPPSSGAPPSAASVFGAIAALGVPAAQAVHPQPVLSAKPLRLNAGTVPLGAPPRFTSLDAGDGDEPFQVPVSDMPGEERQPAGAGLGLSFAMEHAEKESEKSVDSVTLGPRPTLADFSVGVRLGKRNKIEGAQRYYGVKSAVFSARHKSKPEAALSLKVIFNITGAATDCLEEDMKDDFSVTSDAERLPFHANILRTLGHFVDTASVETLGDSWHEGETGDVKESTLFVIMPQLDTTLREEIRRRAEARSSKAPFFSAEEFLCIVVRLLRGAAHLHTHEIVHRDLKPDNVLLGGSGCGAAVFPPVVKIADFGESLDLREDEFEDFLMDYRTRHQSLGGAPMYLPPEVTKTKHGKRAQVNYQKCDVFAVGMVAHQMLSGMTASPFQGENSKVYTADTYNAPPACYSEGLRKLVWEMCNPDFADRLTVHHALAAAESQLASLLAPSPQQMVPGPPKPPAALNQPGKWGFFLSHTRRSGHAICLAAELDRDLGREGHTCWLDVRMDDCSCPAMQEGATKSTVVLAIITGPCENPDKPEDPREDNAYYSRGFCLQELRWAMEAGAVIQPIVRAEDKHRITEFSNKLPEDLRDYMSTNSYIHLDRNDREYWTVGLNKLLRVLKKQPARRHGFAQ